MMDIASGYYFAYYLSTRPEVI